MNKQTPASGQPRVAESVQTLVAASEPALMTSTEAIAYLRLDCGDSNPAERLRNLIRRQGLPVLKRGRLQRFRRSDIDAWLNGTKTSRPARLVGAQRLRA